MGNRRSPRYTRGVNGDTNLWFSLVSAVGMIVVAAVAATLWLRASRLGWRLLWAGAGLWAASVIVKFFIAAVINARVFEFLKANLPYAALLIAGALYVGLQSSLCEIGFTWWAAWRWPQLGRDAKRALGVGIGAGAFEAFLLGTAGLIAVLAALGNVANTEAIRANINQAAAVTPLFWLVGPAERIIAILVHTSSRALVLLGTVYRRPMMVFCGFLIFTLLDGVAGAVHVAGNLGTYSLWWIELGLLPFAIISIPILKWCASRWPDSEEASGPSENP